MKNLKKLIGRVLISTEISTNTIVAINGDVENDKSAILTLSNVLYFKDYTLHINNPISIVPSDKVLNDLIGYKVKNTIERLHEVEIQFSYGFKLIINMRDEIYYDPEAMCLHGPDNLIVVWP